jgi:hypothetical protein
MMPQTQTAPRSERRAARFPKHGLTSRRHGWGYHKVTPVSSIPSLGAIAQRMPRGVVERDNQGGHYVECVGPEAASKKGWKRRRRTLHIWRNVEPNGTVKLGYQSFAEPRLSFREIDDYVRRYLGGPTYVPARRPRRGRDPEAIKRAHQRQSAKRKAERAANRKTPLQASQPWKALGISRATFYRRGLHREAVRQNPPRPITEFHQPIPSVVKHGGRTTDSEIAADSESVVLGRESEHWSARDGKNQQATPQSQERQSAGQHNRPRRWATMSEMRRGDTNPRAQGDQGKGVSAAVLLQPVVLLREPAMPDHNDHAAGVHRRAGRLGARSAGRGGAGHARAHARGSPGGVSGL